MFKPSTKNQQTFKNSSLGNIQGVFFKPKILLKALH